MTQRGRRSDYMIWVDCEMTGLDPIQHVLLEVACIITDFNLSVVAYGPDVVIAQPPDALAGMSDWPRETHTRSGLLQKVADKGVPLAEAEQQILEFLRGYCLPQTAPLCGNNVGHDKRFVAAYMPELYAFLHYRVVDVSTLKLLVTHWYGGKYLPPPKEEQHRALIDIEESIEELRYYRSHVFVMD